MLEYKSLLDLSAKVIIYVPRQYLNVVINLIVVIDLTVVFIEIVVKLTAAAET